MAFKAKVSDRTRDFWRSVERGAEKYEALPDWQKGRLVEPDTRDSANNAGVGGEPSQDSSPSGNRGSGT